MKTPFSVIASVLIKNALKSVAISKSKKYFLFLWTSLFFVELAYAIPPPDILLSGLQSAMQFFGVVVVFFISGFFLLKDFLKNVWQLHRKKCLAVFLVLFLVVVGGICFYFLEI